MTELATLIAVSVCMGLYAAFMIVMCVKMYALLQDVKRVNRR